MVRAHARDSFFARFTGYPVVVWLISLSLSTRCAAVKDVRSKISASAGWFHLYVHLKGAAVWRFEAGGRVDL